MAILSRVPDLDPRSRRWAMFALQTLVVAVASLAAGRLGLLRQLVVTGTVSPIWPPSGVAVAALLILGIRAWAGIALGVVLVVASNGALCALTVLDAAGSTAAPVLAWLLLRRVGFRTDLARLRDGLALVFLAALTAMLLSASVGAGLLVVKGELDSGSFWPVWLAWWVGDAMGVLVVTPVLLLLRSVPLPPAVGRRLEAAALFLVTAVAVPLAARSEMSMLFLVYPLLIWAALRFQLAGSMLCVLYTSVMATLAATDGAGPFAGLTRIEVMLKLQAFNGTMALTALLLSAVITEQRNTRRSVERACQELVEILEHLTAGDTPPGRRTKEPEVLPGDG